MTLQVDDAAKLRQTMVAKLRAEGLITTEGVAAAMMVVPRHDFAPGEPLEKVYQTNTTLVPKIDAQGRQTSVVSASHIQAIQLELADVRKGMNVLEIGSGGYNSALIAEVVGPTGSTTTVDIDADVIDRARAGLQRAGYGQVDAVLADAEHGVDKHAPYERIIVTVGAWDIPPAWLEQLTPQGRIVVPLRFAGITRLIALDRTPDGPALIASNYRLGSFVPMQGDGAADEQLIAVTPDVGLRLDHSSDLTVDVPGLRKALNTAPVESWSGTPFDMPDELELYLLTNGPELPMLHAAQTAVDHGVVNRTVRNGTPALVRGDTLAYRIKRANPQTISGFETGVIAHGTQADEVGNELVDMIRTWADQHYRRCAAHIAYHPKPVDPDHLAGWQTTKRHGVLTVTWP